MPWKVRPLIGLSPRGRGNLADRAEHQPLIGSIPAWAGEPWRVNWWSIALGVYPRVGGGTIVLVMEGI